MILFILIIVYIILFILNIVYMILFILIIVYIILFNSKLTILFNVTYLLDSHLIM